MNIVNNYFNEVMAKFSLPTSMQVDAMIVGSHFKRDGKWYNDLEKSRVEQFMNTWAAQQ